MRRRITVFLKRSSTCAALLATLTLLAHASLIPKASELLFSTIVR